MPKRLPRWLHSLLWCGLAAVLVSAVIRALWLATAEHALAAAAIWAAIALVAFAAIRPVHRAWMRRYPPDEDL